MIRPPAELPDQFDVELVSPFGLMIRPRAATAEITDVPVPVAQELARECHLLIFRGFEPLPGPDHLARYAASWGEVLAWPFGQELDLVEHEHPADQVCDHTAVSLHWDGMFVDRIPEFQISQCINAVDRGRGGRTVFCDTTRVLDHADTATHQLWQSLNVTYRVAKESHDGGTTMSALVVKHPTGGFPIMRYLERVGAHTSYVNRPQITFHDVPDERVPGIEQTLRDALYDPRHCYAHEWRTGDVVVADNYTLLHGREPYASKCGRHLRCVHVLGDPPLLNPGLRHQIRGKRGTTG